MAAMNRARHLAILMLPFVFPELTHPEPLAVSTDFPGGSAELRALDPAAGRIEIAPSHHPDTGWPCWWYFRVEGATPGQAITLRVGASDKPYRGNTKLAAAWSLPLRASISTDDATWLHTPPGIVTNGHATYAIPAPAPRFWMAWGPPFLPSHAEALLASAAMRLPGSERFVLAKTRGGRPVPGIRIGKVGAPRAIWAQARQHAWETGSSWVGRGFLEWVAGEDPAAVALRETTEIWFIPIMDVDRVTIGAGGKEAVPRDHNRDWDEAPIYPEVAAAQQRLRSLAEGGRLRLFLDLHNPSPGDKRPYFYGPLDYEEMPPTKREDYDRLLRCTVEAMRGPLAIDPKYRFATYVKTDEERRRVSGAWARRNCGDDTVAVCLETAWNTPESTAEGYRRVGREFGQAVASYLQTPSPKPSKNQSTPE